MNICGIDFWIEKKYEYLQDKFDEIIILAKFLGYSISKDHGVSTLGDRIKLDFKNDVKRVCLTFKTNGPYVWEILLRLESNFYSRPKGIYNYSDYADEEERMRKINSIIDKFENIIKGD